MRQPIEELQQRLTSRRLRLAWDNDHINLLALAKLRHADLNTVSRLNLSRHTK